MTESNANDFNKQIQERINEMAIEKFKNTGFVLITIDTEISNSAPHMATNLEQESLAEFLIQIGQGMKSDQFKPENITIN